MENITLKNDCCKKVLEAVREEIFKLNITWRDRSENRDDSYDDAFEDGGEVVQKKILALLSVTEK